MERSGAMTRLCHSDWSYCLLCLYIFATGCSHSNRFFPILQTSLEEIFVWTVLIQTSSTMSATYEYRYITTDGQPPNGGFPPSRPRGDAPPTSRPLCYMASYLRPFYSQPSGPPPPYTCTPAPALYKCFGPCISASSGPPQASIPALCMRPSSVPHPPPATSQPPPVPPPPPLVAAGKPHANDPNYPPGGRLNGNGVRFPDGTGYIFPELNTLIHLIEKGAQPWKQPGKPLKFMAFHAPVRMTVNELIRQVGAKVGARAEAADVKFGITEVSECGNGKWTKGSEFRLGEDKSAVTLEDIGWNEERGKSQKPVWLVVVKE